MSLLTRIPDDINTFAQHVLEHKLDVYIFGADIAGKVLHKILKEQGIHVSGFIDNNKNKCNELIDQIEVLHATEKLAAIRKTAAILIASTYISDIIRQLEDIGLYNWVPITKILKSKSKSYFSNLLTGDLRRNHSGGEFTPDFDIFVLENMMNSQEKYMDSNKLFIRSIDLILTEKCSLKCKDCSNLMQYYESPQNIGLTELKADIDDICSVADEINEIRIIGGDPLMHKEFHQVVAYAAEKENVNKVVVYTNGTIAPSEEKIAAISNSKVFVFITTYGALSGRTLALRQLLEQYDIPHNCQPAYGWTDCAEIKNHSRTESESESIFRNCCAKHFTTLTDGKIFRCPFSANMERLAALPHHPDDYVNIRGTFLLDEVNRRKVKANLWLFLREKASIKACDFCNGRTYGDPEITPGVQVKNPISYIKFDRVHAL